MPRVEYSTRYVRARPTIAFLLSSLPHLRPGTVTTRLCIRAMGSEFEFMNIDAAIANDLSVIPPSDIMCGVTKSGLTFATSSAS